MCCIGIYKDQSLLIDVPRKKDILRCCGNRCVSISFTGNLKVYGCVHIDITDAQVNQTILNRYCKAFVGRKASYVNADNILPRVIVLIQKNRGKNIHAYILAFTYVLVYTLIFQGNLRCLILTVINQNSKLRNGDKLLCNVKRTVTQSNLVITVFTKSSYNSVFSHVYSVGTDNKCFGIYRYQGIVFHIIFATLIARKCFVCLKFFLCESNLDVIPVYDLIVNRCCIIFVCYTVYVSDSAKEITVDEIGSCCSVLKSDC